MKCAHCILIAADGEPDLAPGAVASVGVAVTSVRGTSLCTRHALRMLEKLSVQLELGVVPPNGNLE